MIGGNGEAVGSPSLARLKLSALDKTALPVVDGSSVAATSDNRARVAVFAKVVVAATLVLIFLGGLVTSWQAGMAVPDWPLSFGSLNPHGWWENFPVRLEHGHRLFASCVGLAVTILCAWVWNDFLALGGAIGGSIILTTIAKFSGVPSLIVMHVSIWSMAGLFAALLLARRRETALSSPVRWLCFAAFVGICLQATLGGLRVTIETAGNVSVATAFRVFHGCVAQAELCVLVAAATLLSPRWQEPVRSPVSLPLRRLAWSLPVVVYLQLIVGATMRHLQVGLVIPTFPAAAPNGSWLPTVHNAFVDLNFTHTRVGALAVTVLLVTVAISVLRKAPGEAPIAWTLLALVGIQVTLGVLVIWHTKPRTLTTFHVVNGALLLATSLWLALRLSRTSNPSHSHEATV